MAVKSKIAWTDATWNCIAGCTKVSEGCRSCYALRDAYRMSCNPAPKIAGPYQGTTTKDGNGNLAWTGRVNLVPEKLSLPLSWKRPMRIFVNSLSDLFHPEVPFEFLNCMFEIMYEASHHTFQILTKRPQRMLEYLTYLGRIDDNWPYPNVWMGVSAEDRATLVERIGYLRCIAAAVRWVSLEPYLVEVPEDIMREYVAGGEPRHGEALKLDWIVVGGESGPRARPMSPDWVTRLRDMCVDAGVAFNFKQWGSWLPLSPHYPHTGHTAKVDGKKRDLKIGAQEGNGLEGYNYAHVPKHVSGRRLNGEIWDQFPDDKGES